MKQFIFIIILSTYSLAAILDQFYLFQAQVAYKQNNLKESLDYYNKIESKSNHILYNMGNILYKQKKYQDAILKYEKIDINNLNYKTLHNLGNSYAKLSKFKIAINFYKQALNIENNNDTRQNLNLLIKIQKLKKMKDNKKSKKKEMTDKKIKGSENNVDSFDDIYFEDKVSGNIKNKKIIIYKNNISQLKSKNIDEEYSLKDDKIIKKNRTYNDINEDFSKLEEIKWDKSLNNRGMNSLIIPLTKKGTQDETNKYPW